MECPNCQTKNRTGARFCAACGSRLPESEPVVTAEFEAGHESPAEKAEASLEKREPPPAAETAAADVESREVGRPEEDEHVAGLEESGELDVAPTDGETQTATEQADTEAGTPGDAEAHAGEGLTPLPAGTLLADRYEIVELISSDSDGNVYSALDWARCPVCGFEGNTPGHEYCADCGGVLDSPPMCEIREQAEHVEPETIARFSTDGRAYSVLAPESMDQMDGTALTQPPRPRLHWAVATDLGQVRALNEDSVGAHVYASETGPALGLFVVADGVGGQAAGEVASQVATHVIWEKIRETVWLPELRGESVLPETMETRVEEAVQAANQAVYRQRSTQGTDMGTTVTLALVRDHVAVIANVGDSRTYLWNSQGLRQLTADHSLVQSLIDAGEVEPEMIYTHPQRNIIYRSVGDRPRVEIDTFVHELAPGDRLILCSDGLWEMARDEGIEEILLREPVPQTACHALIERANLAGGSDNISVIVVVIEGHGTGL